MVKLIHTLADHDDDVNCCAFSSSLLATCSLDKTIRLYSLSDFSELPHSPLKFHTYAVHCCCFSPSGHILASCSTDGTTVLWDTQNGQTLAVMEQPSGSPVRVCRFSPDSTCLVSGAADGTVVLWNAQSYKLYRCASVKDGSLVACAFSPNGNLFVTGSSCGDLTLWDDKMRCLHSEKAHDLGITCCDFSSQPVSGGEQGLQFFRLASCGQDCQIKIWVISFTHTLARIAEDQPKQFTEDWSEDDVSNWLCAQGLKDLVGIFKMNNIDGRELLNLTKESLADDLKIESLGLRSKVLRKIEELRTKIKTLSSGIPDEFICPITRELMKDPVIASDGYSYEKEAMENWISKKKRTSPMTNLVLPSVVLIPNRTLKMAIDRWLETHQK
uniref:WD repeat, SAM and U-box domain-containing protein 1 n=1 Tax=Balaenoptera musculus TaxID=9771 RepID=A0A8C0D484_BALMU